MRKKLNITSDLNKELFTDVINFDDIKWEKPTRYLVDYEKNFYLFNVDSLIEKNESIFYTYFYEGKIEKVTYNDVFNYLKLVLTESGATKSKFWFNYIDGLRVWFENENDTIESITDMSIDDFIHNLLVGFTNNGLEPILMFNYYFQYRFNDCHISNYKE